MSRLAGVMATLCLAGLLAPSAGAGFTGTPASVKLVREMRAAYKTIGATGYVLTGGVVYCPSAAEGWTFAPQPGCTGPARVSEVDDLVNGRVVRAVGHVSSPSRPTLRYVVSSLGWFQAAAGAPCWRSFGLPFVAAQFVSYPFPGQRLSIIRRTRGEIVIQAITSRSGYRELDYVNPRTDFEYREVLFTHTAHKTYRVVYRIHRAAASPAPATPACGA
jgi:hypothetical protein